MRYTCSVTDQVLFRQFDQLRLVLWKSFKINGVNKKVNSISLLPVTF